MERIVNAGKSSRSKGEAPILHGRGVGIHEQKKLLGIPIEPEKDIILTLIHKDQTKDVLKAIVQAGQLENRNRHRFC